MRVRILKEGTGYDVGTEVEFNNRIATAWIARGLAVEAAVSQGPVVAQNVSADGSGVVGGLHTGNSPVGG